MQHNFLLKDSVYYQLYFTVLKAEPFVKWAGGKRQIIDEIHNFLPQSLEDHEITYIEPFVGGGAVYFSLFNSPNIKKSILIDNNPILIISYKIIKNHLDELIGNLFSLEKEYKKYQDDNFQSNFYYNIRDKYNDLIKISDLEKENPNWIKLASMFIFLNRTCFNGLYRVNSKGEFNVPRGSYKNPNICNSDNLYQVSRALEKSEIYHDDFEKAEQFIDSRSFVYLDPPYRPLKSSGFTSYTKIDFNDDEQIRLAEFCHKIDKLGGKFLLSNSDPKNIDPNDDFFDDLYSKFHIERIYARRNINSNGNERGLVSELLIMNY
ncbi:MAG: Dam family site-specific DNA-(adenine-N6)-methyltransferase [Chloroflexota bacterium]|nr:Dam family site-specific DNA-(adenine-N6)-methyltransferase [Chloroflexota bacterium]